MLPPNFISIRQKKHISSSTTCFHQQILSIKPYFALLQSSNPMTSNYLKPCISRFIAIFSHFRVHFSSISYSNDAEMSRKEQRVLSLLKRSRSTRDVETMHSHVIKLGFHQNLFILGKIICFCAVNPRGSMDYAVSVLEKIENPDGFLWNTMIRGFVRLGQVDRVFHYYKKMQEIGESADNFTLSFLLKISGQLGLVFLGKQMHCVAIKHGFEHHVFVKNTLIHMYGMNKEIEAARQSFDEMPDQELVAWNTIIDCHVNCCKYKDALELFLRMQQNKIEPDEVTLVVTLSACAASGALDFGRWVHSCTNYTRFTGSISPSNSLIDMYAKCGAVEEAYKTFNNMKTRNIVTWNAMILGLAVHGHTNEALTLFSRLIDGKLESPNDVTFLGVLCACSHGGMVEEGREYFNSMTTKYNIQPNIKHFGCMVDILGRAGHVEEAYELVKNMPIKCNAIVYRTLLAACSVHGKIELGEQVRKEIIEFEPDHSSDYVLLANMYASLGQWNAVATIRNSMRDQGVQKSNPGNTIVETMPETRSIKAS